MDFRHSERSQALQDQVRQFLDEQVYPAERDYAEQTAANRAAGDPFRTPDVLTYLKSRARSAGLWNLFLPDDRYGAGLSVLDYARCSRTRRRPSDGCDLCSTVRSDHASR